MTNVFIGSYRGDELINNASYHVEFTNMTTVLSSFLLFIVMLHLKWRKTFSSQIFFLL